MKLGKPAEPVVHGWYIDIPTWLVWLGRLFRLPVLPNLAYWFGADTLAPWLAKLSSGVVDLFYHYVRRGFWIPICPSRCMILGILGS